ncbi:MAG: hypothetical protein EHM58_00850 [Ignavibacteriae bacterium]|nr:MAG: hypothetical protein EHM58_00850 [Ignavibacteriota bacterium]
MELKTKRLAGLLFIILPTVAFGGVSLLSMLIDPDSGYMQNKLRQDLWRAGHAHAGVLLILSLLILRYVDQANLSGSLKGFIRIGVPIAAIMLPLAFFLSVLDKDATEPNAMIYLAYAGFVMLIITLILLGYGLMKKNV